METLKLIPLLYYDLISRVVPGIVLNLFIILSFHHALWKAWGGAASQAVNGPQVSLVLLVALLGTGYISGQMLAPVSDSLERLAATALPWLWRPVLQHAARAEDGPLTSGVREFIRENLKARAMQPNQASSQDCEMVLFEWYDAVRMDSTDLGGRLTKMRAEYRMYSGIGAAGLLAGALHLFRWGLGGTLSPMLTGMAAATFLLGLWGSGRMYRMFQISVIIHYYIRRNH